MVLGDAVSKSETFVSILNPRHISRSTTLSLFTLKASYLVKSPISTWYFMWWRQFIDLLKFETRPSSLLNFGTANLVKNSMDCVSVICKLAMKWYLMRMCASWLCPFKVLDWFAFWTPQVGFHISRLPRTLLPWILFFVTCSDAEME